MNHIFKTVLNKSTGLISVVSENTSNKCKSHKTKSLVKERCESHGVRGLVSTYKKNLLTIMVGVALTTCLSSIAYAQDYTGTEPLTSTVDIGGSIEDLLGGGVKNGIIVIDNNGIPSTGNTEININYVTGATPDFIISGYMDLSDLTEDEVNANSNIINLKSGNIEGDIYAGLAHYTKVEDRLYCGSEGCLPEYVDISAGSKQVVSNHNSVNILGENSITGQSSIYAGYIGTNLKVGDIATEILDQNISVGIDVGDNNYESISNSISLVGEQHIFNDITAGYVGLNIKSGDLNALAKTSDLSGGVQANTSGNRLNASENIVNIQGGNNKFQDLTSGYSLLSIHSGDFELGLENEDLKFDASIVVQAIDNEFKTNENRLVVNGDGNVFENLRVGYTGFDIQSGEVLSTDSQKGISITTESNSIGGFLQSNTNNIIIKGEGNRFKEILTGYAGFNVNYSHLNSGSSSIYATETIAKAMLNDNKFYTDGNSLELMVSNTVTDDLKIGRAGIDIQFGDQSGGNDGVDEISKVDTTVTTNANLLNANKNKIILSGNNNSIADILTGQAGVRIKSGNVTSAGKAAKVNIMVNSNSNMVEANENKINVLGNNNSFNNLTAGSVGIDIQFGQLNAGMASFTGDDVVSDANMMIVSFGNSLSADQNEINLGGKDNKFNNITAGYAGFNINIGNVEGGKTTTSGGDHYGDAVIDIMGSGTILSANNNKINLTGSSAVNGDMHAGYIDFNIEHGFAKKADGTDGEIIVALEGTEAYATANSITIEGQHKFSNKDSVIYGGYLAYNKDLDYKPETYDVFTDNTLNYANRTPIRIKEIGNFQTYNFTLSPELGNTDIALIHAETVSLGANSDNISDGTTTASDIYVTGIHSGKAISTNTEFILMKGDNLAGEGTGHITNGIKQAQQGISLLYDVETKVDKANNQVTATILAGHEPIVNPQLKSLLEGNLAGLMLLTRSADNIAYNTFSAITEQNRHKGLVPFVQMSGHHARYNSGSHIDANGGLLTAGISFQNDNLTLAIFSENGWADYDSHNTFTDFAKVDATGNNRFNGGGIYGQYNFNNGLYTDASFRAGRLHTSYKTDDIRNVVTGESAHYKTTGDYLSAHVGVGYQFQINSLNHYDLNLKYLWTGTDAQNLKVAGDDIHFDKLNSHRLRLNGENSYQFNPNWSLLLGTGLEYEFDGKAEGTTYHVYSLNAPSVQGLTATGSLGVRFQPVSNKNLTIDFKGQGYLGERDGGGATLHMQYAF